MKNDFVTAIILAAGKGSRMKAPPTKNKVTYKVHGKPLILHTRETLKKAGIKSVIAVVGYAKESVKAVLKRTVKYAEQKKQLGTGHAVKMAMPLIPTKSKYVISMYGDDSAFYTPKLISEIIQSHIQNNACVTVLTVKRDDPTGLGRIIRNKKGIVLGIVEEKNASKSQKLINEINTGLYCFDKSFLIKALKAIKLNPITKEYYLTDVIEYAVNNNKPVNSVLSTDTNVWFGVNTPENLAEANSLLRRLNLIIAIFKQSISKFIKSWPITLNSQQRNYPISNI